MVHDFKVRLKSFSTTAQCSSWCKRIFNLRDFWLARDLGLSTLGAVAYLDAPDAETATWFGVGSFLERYQAELGRLNPLLKSEFSDLYDLLKIFLAQQLAVDEQQLAYSDHKALPGFHIHGPHLAYARQRSHIPHFDRPYASLCWKHEGVDDRCTLDHRRQLSFTLTLQLPPDGGGLRIWNLQRSQALGMSVEALKARLKAEHADVHRYAVGGLLLHTGQELHQILAWDSQPSDQERITLQGHALEIDGRWILYW